MKQIYIVTGAPRVGKDTLHKLIAEVTGVRSFNISMVDCVRDIMRILDITEIKESDSNIKHRSQMVSLQRQQMSDCKAYLDKFLLPINDVMQKIDLIYDNYPEFAITVQCRELHNIQLLKQELERTYTDVTVLTTLITRDESLNPLESMISNDSDKNHDGFDFDCIICNSGTMDEYRQVVSDILQSIPTLVRR